MASKRHLNIGRGHGEGHCRGCRRWFVGPGERCQDCAHLVKVKAAKRRRRR